MTDTDLATVDSSASLPDAVATETSVPAPTEADPSAPRAAKASAGGTSLSAMVLPELRALAVSVGVKGTSGMRKSDLIAAIRDRQDNTALATKSNGAGRAENTSADPPVADAAPEAAEAPPRRRERRGASRDTGTPLQGDAEQRQDTAELAPEQPGNESAAASTVTEPDQQGAKRADQWDGRTADQQDGGQGNNHQGGQQNRNNNRNSNRAENNNRNDNRGENSNNRGDNNNRNDSNRNDDDDDGDGRQGRRGRRFRDRRRRERDGSPGGSGANNTESELREDDVVQPVAGILDVLDNYAFVRTSGYLAGPNDVYVSMNMVRKNGLRRGDAVTGAVRVAKETPSGDSGQNARQKFNPLVRLDTVNGGPVDDAKKRPDFTKLTPLYPNQRLRLETTPDRLTTRIIDLIMPIGKGQRALIVSPPKAGKTTILQDIANAITVNNPECHLMVVLVDERPEEVTDMQRSVKGEVIASTFDRPPSDHTQAAELAIERAKRLVEQGKDVVVLLDSITRLGRAYNNASPASGRILSGGVDSTALYPPKRFLGAARNIEFGGSLTIIATAMVETGSTGDTVIFEEFKGTGNAELKLDRKISERRVFPAVDVNPSGTRKDELLLSPDEFGIVHKLRRVLSGLDSHQAIDLLMSQLRKTKTNYEFLMQVSKTTPGNMDND
ncbi:MAG: transcription termination factor Rho [Mycobacterium sp.]